ncbi:MAG TPA: hypothetical protein VLX61_01645 [Anaerolineales bacterium]|nr:hypothetical protein [Anaerolineales bacterium]
MTRLSILGNIADFPQDAVAIWATGALVNPFYLLNDLHWAQSFAMPGKANRVYLREIEGTINQLRINSEIVDDPRIAGVINKVISSLEAFAIAAKEIREWQEIHVSKQVMSAHNKAVRVKGPLDPPWKDDEEFKNLLQKSSSAFSLYLDTLSESISVIRAITPIGLQKTLFEQLDRTEKQIPGARLILKIGYAEAIRRNSTKSDFLPAA